MDERRQHRRRPWAHPINFQLGKDDSGEAGMVSLGGQAADISAGGLRIKSEKALSPGLRIFFGETNLSGIVKWNCISGGAYIAGIQLF